MPPLIRESLVLLAALAAPLQAELTFRPAIVRERIAPQQKTLQSAFSFTNTGTSPVSITRIHPHCECTQARVEGSSTIAPGASGRILLDIDTKTFTGTVRKDVSVTTSDGKTQKLTIAVSVPESITVSPKGLAWKQGGPATAKTVTITLAPNCPFRLTQASLVGDAFDYQTNAVVPGKRYTVTVTPKSTQKKLINRLLIETDSQDPRYARIPVFLSIHPSAS